MSTSKLHLNTNVNTTLKRGRDARQSSDRDSGRRQPWRAPVRALRNLGGALLTAVGLALGTSLLIHSPQLAAAEPAPPAVVNINAADAATLAATLKGVGQSRALEIVRHREKYGPFASPDELVEVTGIGPATLDINRQRITLK